MFTYRRLDRRAPDEIRKQIALQLQVDNAHSAGFADLRPDDDVWALIARADECLCARRRRSQRRDWRIAE